jgi:16S rRNA (cytidine1402-2'-O)-methyltransferase
MNEATSGTLYVVGTPIGNLDDLSPRARSVLGAVDLIAAEDTRRTRRLLSSIGVNCKLIGYHDHNEREQTPGLVNRLQRGESLALVSDAGMPSISDPGIRLVRAALAADLAVVTVPGASAAAAALTISGLATDRYVFEGFLPRRGAARKQRLEALRSESRTMIFYEAVHRVGEAIDALVEVFGANRQAALARELTKIHEQLQTGTLAELRACLDNTIPLKGEFVLLVAGCGELASASEAEAIRIFALLSKEVSAKSAVALSAEITGLSRNEVYRLTRGAQN